MPVQPTYPGVYIQQVSGGSETITAVPTSITAFLGRTPFGPVGSPLSVSSYAEFEHTYGGLTAGFPLSYSVLDFFNNGGSQAVIVRLVDSTAACATANAGPFQLTAANPGTWANTSAGPAGSALPVGLSAQITPTTPSGSPDTIPGYTLTLTYQSHTGATETEHFSDIVLSGATPNRIDHVLATQSQLARTVDYVDPSTGTTPATSLQTGVLSFTGGHDSGPIASVLPGSQSPQTGLYQLEQVDLFHILCIPPDDLSQPDGGIPIAFWAQAAAFCTQRRAMLIAEPPQAWADHARSNDFSQIQPTDLGIVGPTASNAVVYFPRVYIPDPLNAGNNLLASGSGSIAGLWAASDAAHGVWKATAGVSAALSGIASLEIDLTDAQTAVLNPLGINCLRFYPVYGNLVWGARTLAGLGTAANDFQYIPVRRLTLFIEESLYRGTKWSVFEPNNATLWAQLRIAVTTFLDGLFRTGALAGATASDAFFVRCDATTTTPADIANGVVNIQVGFAPVTPAEFITLNIAQMAGPSASS